MSGPLIVQTFKKYFGKTPDKIYDKFNVRSSNAASIGQVHQAELNGKKLAVKIQYPGVGDSISSDLKLVKPFAFRMLGMSEKELDIYMREVENACWKKPIMNWRCAGPSNFLKPVQVGQCGVPKILP